MRVLFVCLGNICRSPMAEAVFNKHLAVQGLTDSVSCDSAGTAGYHIGQLPDYRTRKVCDAHGAPLSHLGRKLVKSDLDEFDLVLAMDHANLEDILNLPGLSEAQKSKVKLLRSYEPNGGEKEVPDPYYGNLEDFERIYTIIDRCCQQLVEDLKQA